MKPLICFILAALLALPLSMSASASTKKHCTCQQQKHYKKHYSSYYVPGYCKTRCCPYSCKTVSYCRPGRYITCRTDFYYHRGRNTSKVEVCG